jgi:hypothetical protein
MVTHLLLNSQNSLLFSVQSRPLFSLCRKKKILRENLEENAKIKEEEEHNRLVPYTTLSFSHFLSHIFLSPKKR